MLKNFLRLIKESFFVLLRLKNPLVYYLERLGLSRTPKIGLKFWNGVSYTLHAGTNEIRMVNEIWNTKVYDRLMPNIRADSVVVDIGANIGVFSIKAVQAAKGVKVFSYEPFPESFALLEENIALNGLAGNVFPKNVAVAGGRREVELFFRKNDPGGVSIRQYGDRAELSSIKVAAITLEDIFRENGIKTCDFLKMDCEGAEEEILLGAPKGLFDRIRSITLEWHEDLNKMTEGEFESFLRGLGYETKYNAPTQILCAWRTRT